MFFTPLTLTAILVFSLAFPEVPGQAVLSFVTSPPVASGMPVLSSPVVLVISDGESQFERVNSQSTFFRSAVSVKSPRDHNNSFVPMRNAGFQSLQEMSESCGLCGKMLVGTEIGDLDLAQQQP